MRPLLLALAIFYAGFCGAWPWANYEAPEPEPVVTADTSVDVDDLPRFLQPLFYGREWPIRV